MVCVCPPQTSMNFCWSSPVASFSMVPSSARAAAGSRNSSTNRTVGPPGSADRGVLERLDLVGIGGAELLHGGQGQQRLGLVDARHREADVHQHPLVGRG